jgi:hypothetical protein
MPRLFDYEQTRDKSVTISRYAALIVILFTLTFISSDAEARYMFVRKIVGMVLSIVGAPLPQ